jgi:uncharacterized protein YjiS (DUF1127 family)
MTMTTSHCSTPMVHPVAPAGFPIIRFLRDVIARTRRRRREAIQLAHLQSLDDYLLADIGLTRDRVSGIIGDPHVVRWQRPPDLW